MAKVAIISGSPSETSRLNGVLELVSEVIASNGHEIEWVHVRQLPAEDLMFTKFDSPAILAANRIVEHADALVIATPNYKASYTGVLQTYLDLVPPKSLEGKTILPVAIGGMAAHLLAIDRALKPVLSVHGARYHHWNGVYALDSQVQRIDNNKFELDEELVQRIKTAVQEYTQEVKAREGFIGTEGAALALSGERHSGNADIACQTARRG
ncbi:NADPH-dependent FMN reductase [Paenibacillus silviterrae]|uniref:NADPH-dependent FMN reductase n=1 Tax=Paenibacillus silviterrae TaxID=3242194 RepID=UPI00254352F7|nr:NADPH-dependent FMN reductase [Paenibacillus chinjuensis]